MIDAREWLTKEGWTDADNDNHRSHIWWLWRMGEFAAEATADLRQQLQVQKDYALSLGEVIAKCTERAEKLESDLAAARQQVAELHNVLNLLDLDYKLPPAPGVEPEREAIDPTPLELALRKPIKCQHGVVWEYCMACKISLTAHSGSATS